MSTPIDAAIGLLACPVCGAHLERTDRVLRCAERHSFDIAKQGYVNLLRGPAPANADTAEMVAARDRFLQGGSYRPIADAVRDAAPTTGAIAEVGAGTGYYLASVLADRPASSPHVALDISAAACRRAARSGLASAVADTWAGLPLRDGVLDAVLCVFAPRNPAEFARVLAPAGRVLVVTPDASHLAELRAEHDLLDVPADKLDRLDAAMASANLTVFGRTKVFYEVDLDPGAIADLIQMGPNAFHQRPGHPIAPGTVRIAVWVSSYTSTITA